MLYKLFKEYLHSALSFLSIKYYSYPHKDRIYIACIALTALLLISLNYGIYILNIVLLPMFILGYTFFVKIHLDFIKKSFDKPYLIIDLILFIILTIFLFVFIRHHQESLLYISILIVILSAKTMMILKFTTNTIYKGKKIEDIHSMKFVIFSENIVIFLYLMLSSLFPVFVEFFLLLFLITIFIKIIIRTILIYNTKKDNKNDSKTKT